MKKWSKGILVLGLVASVLGSYPVAAQATVSNNEAEASQVAQAKEHSIVRYVLVNAQDNTEGLVFYFLVEGNRDQAVSAAHKWLVEQGLEKDGMAGVKEYKPAKERETSEGLVTASVYDASQTIQNFAALKKKFDSYLAQLPLEDEADKQVLPVISLPAPKPEQKPAESSQASESKPAESKPAESSQALDSEACDVSTGLDSAGLDSKSESKESQSSSSKVEVKKESKRENKKGLPNTGEVDRLPFLLVGALLVIAAIGLILMRRRRS